MAKSRPPTEILQSISQKAAKVRQVADDLTRRIEQFQTYLANVSGRVDTRCFGRHPDDGPDGQMELGLRLHRTGKSWIISWLSYHPQMEQWDQDLDWQPLMDAPLRIKIAAVKLFPELLDSIDRSQDELAKEITDATKVYDAFAATLAPLGQPIASLEKLRESLDAVAAHNEALAKKGAAK